MIFTLLFALTSRAEETRMDEASARVFWKYTHLSFPTEKEVTPIKSGSRSPASIQVPQPAAPGNETTHSDSSNPTSHKRMSFFDLNPPGADRARIRRSGVSGVKLKWTGLGKKTAQPLALGLNPFLKFPTVKNDLVYRKVEGGLELPLIVSLPADWSLNLTPSWTRRIRDSGAIMNEIYTGAIFQHALTELLWGYAQVFNVSSDAPDKGATASTGFGFACKLSQNTQLDAGPNFGITPASDPFTLTVGLVIRL